MENATLTGDVTCRVGCAACCIAASISSPIPAMPHGKPAGVRCVQLTADNLCAVFGRADRPAVCTSFRPSLEMCGRDRAEALAWLERLERATRPEEVEPPRRPGSGARVVLAPETEEVDRAADARIVVPDQLLAT
jgi:uncharacterized protein